MTTPRWIKSAYVKSILAVLLILGLLLTFVCLNSYDVFSSSSQSSQDKERQDLSKANSLKALVASWLKGESLYHIPLLFIYEFRNEVDVISILKVSPNLS